jgi:hypothetical protein
MIGNKKIFNTVLLVYEDVEENYWFKDLIKPDFRHCYLLVNNGMEWMKVTCEYGRTYIYLLPVESDQFPTRFLNKMTHCLQIEMKFKARRRISFNIFNHMSCVTFIKLYLGLRVWTHTPYGLYKYLHNMEKTGKYKQTIKSVKSVNKLGGMYGKT